MSRQALRIAVDQNLESTLKICQNQQTSHFSCFRKRPLQKQVD